MEVHQITTINAIKASAPRYDLLLQLADLLDTVPQGNFNMLHYMRRPTDKALGECGTTACALGWASTLPDWQRIGLAFTLTSTHGTRPDSWWLHVPAGMPQFSGGSEVISELLNLPETDVKYLFFEEGLRTPSEEATIIRDYVKTHAAVSAA